MESSTNVPERENVRYRAIGKVTDALAYEHNEGSVYNTLKEMVEMKTVQLRRVYTPSDQEVVERIKLRNNLPTWGWSD